MSKELKEMPNLVHDHMQHYETICSSAEGYFELLDAQVIALIDNAQKKRSLEGDILEIGVFKGKSFFYLAQFIRHYEKLYGIDVFGKINDENYLDSFIDAANKFNFLSSNCIVMKGNSKALREHPIDSNGFRFIHIDGGHEHEDVLNDLKVVYPLLIDAGAVLCMDDVPNREFPGIWSALCEFIYLHGGGSLRPFLVTRNKMYLSRKKDCHYYLNECIDFIPDYHIRNVFDVACAVTKTKGSVSKRSYGPAPVQVYPCHKC